ERHARAERDERVDVGPGDPAMEDVADDHHALAAELAYGLAKGVGVEEALRGMSVPPVAGIDDGRFGALGDEVRRAGRAVAYHDHVAAEGLQRAYGVEERLALLDRGPGGGDVHDVGRERLRRELEGHARARRDLREEQDHRSPTERRRAADRP